MVWDKTIPANATKLRLSPSIFQANWDAIETGGVPYDTLRMQKQGAAPARLNGHGWIYGKDPGTGFTELYYEDDRNPSKNIQLTDTGTLGATTTEGTFKKLYIGTNSTEIDENNFIIAWGKFNAAGVLLYGKNMTAAGAPHPGAGLFNVNVDADFLLTASYAVFGNVSEAGNAGGSIRGLMPLLTPIPVVATATTIQVEIKRDGGRTDSFDYFFIQIVGGQ